MTAPSSKPPQATYAYLRSDGTAYVVLGSAFAGLAAYAYPLMGGRVLGAESFAPVSVLLTVHFLTFIVVMMIFIGYNRCMGAFFVHVYAYYIFHDFSI